ISLRAEPDCLLAPRDQVLAERAHREPDPATGAFRLMPSFERCATGSPAIGDPAARDCGWAPRFVGRCRAGDPVTVCARPDGPHDPCACTEDPAWSDVMLRVCKGIYGCDHVDDPPRSYAGVLRSASRCSTRATISFVCPMNGPLIDEHADPASGD